MRNQCSGSTVTRSFWPLASRMSNLTPREVDILDAQLQALAQAHARPYSIDDNQPLDPAQSRQHALHFGARQYDRQTLRTLGPHDFRKPGSSISSTSR